MARPELPIARDAIRGGKRFQRRADRGQGLAISHGVVVKKHGGTLDVDTEVGNGTTFQT